METTLGLTAIAGPGSFFKFDRNLCWLGVLIYAAGGLGLSPVGAATEEAGAIGAKVIRAGAIYAQKVARQFSLDHPSVPGPVRAPGRAEPWTGERGPVATLKLMAREESGAVWLGSDQGAARFDPKARHRWDRWQYFCGRRWVADDAIENIWINSAPGARQVWIRTQRGVSLIEWQPMTLEEKARYFDARIEDRHVRHGFVGGVHLRVAGDLSSYQQHDNDNDGLWTAMYLGAQAFRYAVTGAPEARARAKRALEALIRLEAITGKPGFFARSFLSKSEPRPHGGEWHPTPDGEWLWKGDTSSDESVGHYFAYSVYYDLVADEKEKERIRQVVSRLTDHLIEHDYDLIDLDGKPTRWGQWSERYFQTDEGKYEAALRSLELLSFLKTAHHITGRAKYAEAYQDRIRRGYAEQMRFYRRWPGGGEINFSDDELAYLSYYPLLKYEQEKRLRSIYLDGLRFTWRQIESDMNPLWNYISAAGGAGPLRRSLRADSRRTLERIPLDLIDWETRNSHRIDIKFRTNQDRFSRPQLVEVLPPDERPIAKWNSNPYRADGGGAGHGEDDGAFFLLPYWLGRYHGYVE